MVIVAGSFVVAAADRDAFLEGRRSAMEASRAEPGCLDYVFSADPLDPERVVLFERWADQAALDAHLAGMRERRGSGAPPAASASPAPRVEVRSSEVLKYEISSSGPIG
jgi:quinol monooxygenase YgiN